MKRRWKRSRRRDLWLVALAAGLLVLAAMTAISWHDEPRVLVAGDVAAAELAATLEEGIEAATRWGADGLVARLELEEDGEPRRRVVVASRSPELAVVLLADPVVVGGEEPAALAEEMAQQLDEALPPAAGFEPAAIAAAGDWPEAAARIVAFPGELPDGPRAALRSLAWEHGPAVTFGLALAAVGAAVAVTVGWRLRGAYVALALGGGLAFFAESLHPLALASGAAGAAVLALVGLGREPAAPPPERPPPPAEPHDLLVIGTESRLSARVGLAPDDQTVTTDVAGSWFRVLGVSAAGARHLWDAAPLEDHHAVHADGDRLVVAVADGVSSSADSGSGSRMAAERVVGELAGRPPGGDLAAAVRDAFTAVNDAMLRAARGNRSGGRMATTLVVAVAWQDGGERRVVCGRVGDSEALFLSAAGTWERVFGEMGDAEGLRNPATAALPSSRPEVEVKELAWPHHHVLMLASDGVADPLIGRQDLVRRTLGDLWRTPPTVEEFRRHVQFSRKGLDDDRTAVAVWADLERTP